MRILVDVRWEISLSYARVGEILRAIRGEKGEPPRDRRGLSSSDRGVSDSPARVEGLVADVRCLFRLDLLPPLL